MTRIFLHHKSVKINIYFIHRNFISYIHLSLIYISTTEKEELHLPKQAWRKSSHP